MSVSSPTAGHHFAAIAVSLLMAMNGWGATGESTASDSPSDVLHGLRAPVSADSPWQPPDLTGFSSVLKVKTQPEADTQKAYELAELIDLAERAVTGRMKTSHSWAVQNQPL